MKGLMYKNIFQIRRILIFLAGVQLICSGLVIYLVSVPGGMAMETAEDKVGVMLSVGMMSYFVFFIAGIMNSDIFLPDASFAAAGFVISTPQSVKGHLRSKYYTVLMIHVMILFFSFLTDTIVVAIVGDTMVSAVAICVYLFCFEILFAAFQIPFMVRFGASYGLKILGIAIVVVVIFVAVYFLFGDISFLMSDDPMAALKKMLFALVEKSLFVLALLPYLTGVLYYVSYRISFALFRKGMENLEQ